MKKKGRGIPGLWQLLTKFFATPRPATCDCLEKWLICIRIAASRFSPNWKLYLACHAIVMPSCGFRERPMTHKMLRQAGPEPKICGPHRPTPRFSH